MRRRRLLQLAGASSLGLLAGCTGEGPSGEPTDSTDDQADSPTERSPRSSTGSPTDSPTATSTDDPTATSTDTPTDRDSPSPSPSPSPGTGDLESSAFTVTNNECGSGQNSAEGSADGSTVTVTGVIDGSDTCHSAELDDATVEDETLNVAVRSYVPQENEGKVCSECVVDISYEATFEFDGGTPDRAVVVHDGEQVATFSLS